MKGLKTLCLMQLKDRLNLSFLSNTKQTIFKIVLTILKFAIITAFIYFVFYVLSFLRLVSLLPGIPQNFIDVIITLLLLLSIIVCSFGLVKTLYFAKDNFILLTLPQSRTKVFFSKLVVYYIYELTRNFNYILPLFVAYGIINNLPFYFYLWIIVAMFIYTLIPVAIGALLSIPLMYIQSFVKSYRILEYILVSLAVGGATIALILVINAIPDNFDLVGTWGTTFWNIQDFMNKFNQIFIPFTYVGIALIGTRYGISNRLFCLEQNIALIIIISGIALIFGLTFLLVRPLYFYMASTPFEYKKQKINRVIKNKKSGAFLTSVKKDIMVTYRTPSKFYSLLFVILGLPISIFLLNKIYTAMDTRLTGTNMSIAFNVLMILLIALSSNSSISHIYSEEGGASYLIKTSPKPKLNMLLSKLFTNAITMTVSILATTIIFVSFLHISWVQAIFVFITFEGLYLAHLLNSAELDLMNPQTQRYQTEGDNLNNPNDLKSIIYAFLISIAMAVITFFLISENMYSVWIKLMALSVIWFAFRCWLFVNKVKVYFGEVEQ